MRRDFRGGKMAAEFIGSVVRKAKIAGEGNLIEQGRTGEESELLFFDGTARRNEDMGAAGEDSARNFAIERVEKGKAAFLEGNLRIAAVKFNATAGGNDEDGGWIELEVVQRGIELAGRARVGGEAGICTEEKEKEKQDGPGPHRGSVVIYGMAGQAKASGGFAASRKMGYAPEEFARAPCGVLHFLSCRAGTGLRRHNRSKKWAANQRFERFGGRRQSKV